MTRANFNSDGLAIGQNDTNMTYLYGLSDFFSVMFEDTSVVNLILEATTEGPAEIYSRFLQLTSTISLETIQETLGSSIELVILPKTNAVTGSVNLYTLPKNISSSRYIANRPFLPTVILEQDVDYRLEVATDGTVNVRFAADISTQGFSSNVNTSGVAQYALWFVDATIDERLISTMYGNLIGITPQNSTDAFYNFIYGLYYVYVNGPTLDLIKRGLNLVLGIPLARASETVLSIRQYLDTQQYIVITDQNQYIIPYGLAPTVVEGDTLTVGQSLSSWVEIKDYENDGEWWINLQIPASVIPELPAGQTNRYATEGSHFDYLMANYLKKHTFLVNVKVASFENIQAFSQLSDIIRRVKPTYTQPIYIWTIPTLTEELDIDDGDMEIRWDQSRCEKLEYPIHSMYRGNTDSPLYRGCPTFIRSNVPMWITKMMGTDEYINGNQTTVNGGSLSGFVNVQAQFRTNTEVEQGWLNTLFQRNHDQLHVRRNMISFKRGARDITQLSGKPVSWYSVPAGMKVVPLYITKQYDVAVKCLTCNIDVPSINQWVFTLFDPNASSASIDATPINNLAINDQGDTAVINPITQYFNTLFFRGSNVNYLGALIPELGKQAVYAPDVSDIESSDYLMGVRIIEDTVGIYWVTSNKLVKVPQYFPVPDIDNLTISYAMPITRGHSGIGTPFYTLRGQGELDYTDSLGEINGAAIDDESGYNNPIAPNQYSDKYNELMTITRGGTVITHVQELK